MERPRRSKVPAAAVVLAAALLALAAVAPGSSPAAVQAQEAQEIDPAPTSSPVAGAPDAPAGPSWPSAEAIAGAVLGGLGDVIQRALVGFFEQSGAAIFGRLLTAAFGVVASWLWRAAGPSSGGSTSSPSCRRRGATTCRPVGELRGRLEPVARAVVLLGLVLGIGWAVAGTLLGRPFGRLLNVVPTFLLATGGLLVAPQLCRWWIDFCNALSGALLDPATGLPGLAEVRGWEQFSALGVVAVVYLIVCLLLLLHRLKLVVVCALLLAVAPLAVAAGALPVPQAQRFFSWWLSTFLGVTFVQVLQACCLGLGAALLSAPFAGGRADGPAEGMLSALVGIGAITAAMSLPGMLLGSLARAHLAPGVLATALQVATILAGFGFAGAVARGGGFAWARMVPPVGLPPGAPVPPGGAGATVAPALRSGYVRSLLAGQVPALPPPRE